MTFDNSKTLVKLRLRLFVVTILLLAYVLMVYFVEILRFPILGIQEFYATLTLTALYLLLAFMPMIRKYKYIYFSDDGKDIIFRYYSVGFLNSKKNSIEIPKDQFAGYKMHNSWLNLIKSIVLYRTMGSKKASYPPVYLSSLSGSELQKIKIVLNKYLKHK